MHKKNKLKIPNKKNSLCIRFNDEELKQIQSIALDKTEGNLSSCVRYLLFKIALKDNKNK